MNWKNVEAMARSISSDPDVPQYYANVTTLAALYGTNRGRMSSFLIKARVAPYSVSREKKYRLWEVEEALEKSRWHNKDGRGGCRAGSFRDGVIDPI